MKTKLSGGKWLAALLLAGGLSQSASLAADLTGFELIKEGNRHVGEEAKGRVVQIRSEKSIGSLTPNIWYVVYYDPDATAKATEVKFAAGTKVSVKRPARILEPITRSHRELPREKLKVDSNKAIEIAKNDPLLKNLTLTNTELKLERGEGDLPVWKVKLWASKIRKPAETVTLGEIHISAEDGKVVKNDLKPGRVD
ncbi:MAG: hypothetical protein DME18_02325 [Verrucomicrobia bacterium]|nr:MAG: hypothetical protein DME18_02325 [Verrucomicrobiota bacterium]